MDQTRYDSAETHQELANSEDDVIDFEYNHLQASQPKEEYRVIGTYDYLSWRHPVPPRELRLAASSQVNSKGVLRLRNDFLGDNSNLLIEKKMDCLLYVSFLLKFM